MWSTKEGSTGRLAQLCFGYFFFYVITGVTVKYFQGKPQDGFPGMNGMEFLLYSTAGGTLLCLFVAVAFGWYRMESSRYYQWAGVRWPQEISYIIPSGICTAVVIPTTTLMYSLLPSVMVAMVIMRGSVIVISRLVDALQIRQGILKKKVYWEEDVAVLFAIAAVCVNVIGGARGGFEFLRSTAALAVLGSYVLAYLIRIYLMNYYKNTRGKGVKQDNKGFFALEQIVSSIFLLTACLFLFFAPPSLGGDMAEVIQLREAVTSPKEPWPGAILAGMAFGAVAFFSVFIFMFKGRTATFAGLVNRLTSLIAGTTATLISHFTLGDRFPALKDWVALGLILVAVAFLTKGERKRARELISAAAEEQGNAQRAPIARAS
ncbi:MAG: hypothetical protein HY698_08900 [Deltaproteobacteria bacterium]|nr:hypothetical protein [Deltaproteobacteria bacterium]